MKSSENLLTEWKDGMRPARVQQVRDELREYTGMAVPRRRSVIESWVDEHRDEVAQALVDVADVE